MSTHAEPHNLHSLFPKTYADVAQRLRVPCGLLLFVAFAWLSHPSWRSLLAGLPISLVGLLLRAWAAGHLAKDQQLATAGPYAYVRNPLYAGTLMVAAGMLIAARSFWLGAIFIAVFLFVYLPAIELEEQHLATIFAGYREYARRVHRFLPLRQWKDGSSRFSWTRYWSNQEYQALAGFLIAVAWLVWKCWIAGTAK